MSYDQLVDWIDIHTDDDDWKSKDTLIKGIRDDWKGSVKLWVENEGFKSTGKSVYDEEIQTKIDRHNDEYIKKIQDQILSANKAEDIESIKTDEMYESGTAGEIESLKREAIEQMGKGTEEERENILKSIDEIKSAKTINEIDEAIGSSPSTGSVRKTFPDLAGDLSYTLAEAAERKYDLEHP